MLQAADSLVTCLMQVDMLRSHRQSAASVRGVSSEAQTSSMVTVDITPPSHEESSTPTTIGHEVKPAGAENSAELPDSASLSVRMLLDPSFLLESSFTSPRRSSSTGSQSRALTGLAHQPESRRVLRLEGSDAWVPFTYQSIQQLSGSSVLPIRAGPGLALETDFEVGPVLLC